MVTVCDCISAQAADEYSYDLGPFEELRRNCTALRNVVIPQKQWTDYKGFCSADRDEAQHQPIMWLAYGLGYLGNFTGPIHEFILAGKPETNTVTNQYKQDLIERWFLKKDFLERYKASRIFEGRLAELRFASWLRQTGWQISSLEAYGGKFDVEAQNPEGAQTVFEVKYLATEEYRFRLGVEALKNGAGCDSLSLYSPLDYLLCRTYEAAHKLDGAGATRIAVLILGDYSAFDLQLEERWINWDKPRLFSRDQDIQPFLDKFFQQYPDFEKDMGSRFKSLQQIWILQDTRDFGLERKYGIDPITGHQV
jgi:hypothetical protein